MSLFVASAVHMIQEPVDLSELPGDRVVVEEIEVRKKRQELTIRGTGDD